MKTTTMIAFQQVVLPGKSTLGHWHDVIQMTSPREGRETLEYCGDSTCPPAREC